jgi:hypothetical protein
MNINLNKLEPEELNDFNDLVYNYGLKIFILNHLETELAKIRAELADIEDKLITINPINKCTN